MRNLGNTMSAVRLSSGKGRAFTRYRKPSRWSSDRRALSGAVPEDTQARIDRRVDSDFAHDLPRVTNAGRRGLRGTAPRGAARLLGSSSSFTGLAARSGPAAVVNGRRCGP